MSFAETAIGYLRLLEALVATGKIETISRKSIMDYLGMSRAWASKWNSTLNEMRNNCAYSTMVYIGEFGGLTPAHDHLRSNKPSLSSIDMTRERNVFTGYMGKPQAVADVDNPFPINKDASYPKRCFYLAKRIIL